MVGISFENGEEKEMCFGVLLAILKTSEGDGLGDEYRFSMYYFVVGYLLDGNFCGQ